MLVGGTIASQGRSVHLGVSRRIQCFQQHAVLHWITGLVLLFLDCERFLSFKRPCGTTLCRKAVLKCLHCTFPSMSKATVFVCCIVDTLGSSLS